MKTLLKMKEARAYAARINAECSGCFSDANPQHVPCSPPHVSRHLSGMKTTLDTVCLAGGVGWFLLVAGIFARLWVL